MKYLWATLAGVSVVAVSAVYLINQQPPSVATVVPVPGVPVEHHDSAQAARLLELEAQLGDLQARLERAERGQIDATQAEHGGRSSSDQERGARAAQATQPEEVRITHAAAAPRDAVSREQVAAEEQARREQSVARLEGQLAAEDYDSGWAGNFEAELDQGLQADAFAATRLNEVECKSTLCRVSFGHESPEHEEQFFEHLLELPVMANTQAYYTREPNADGSSSLVMYIAREGQSLPLPQRGVN